MELARRLVLYYLKMLDALSVEPQTCSPRRYRWDTITENDLTVRSCGQIGSKI